MNLKRELVGLVEASYSPLENAIKQITSLLKEKAEIGSRHVYIPASKSMDSIMAKYLKEQGLEVEFRADQKDGDFYKIGW